MAGYGVLADAVAWAYIGIALALAVALIVALRRPDTPEYLGAVIWALVGVAVANGADQIGVTFLAVVGILILAATVVRTLKTAHPPHRPPP